MQTFISAMLLQSDINKERLPQLAKLDKLYIDSESTELLQRSKIYFIECKNQQSQNYRLPNFPSIQSPTTYIC